MLGCCNNKEQGLCECKDCATDTKELIIQEKLHDQEGLVENTQWSNPKLKRFTGKSPKPRSVFTPRKDSYSKQETDPAPALIFEPKRQFLEQQLNRFSSRIHAEIKQEKVNSKITEPGSVPAAALAPEEMKPQNKPTELERPQLKTAGGSVLAVIGLLIFGGMLLNARHK